MPPHTASLPRLHTATAATTSTTTSKNSPSKSTGPTLPRSRPASPVLTSAGGPSSAISMHDLAPASFDGSDGYADTRQPRSETVRSKHGASSWSSPLTASSVYPNSHSSTPSRSAGDAALHDREDLQYHHYYDSSSQLGGIGSSTSTSRPASRSSIRARSPAGNSSHAPNLPQNRPMSAAAANSNVPGGGISRASTPLMYSQHPAAQDNSHSSSSFLVSSSSGNSYAQLPTGHPDNNSHADLHAGSSSSYASRTRTRNNPFTTSSKIGIRQWASPAYISHRARQLIEDGKAALAIGVPGEWQDIDTGKRKIPQHLKAYIPLLIWVAVSIAFGVIVGVWHEQVFAGLDALSTYLKSQGYLGDFILYLCIFITTFPPLPLYSTLIILSGYSFGLLEGFIISYTAALSGAVVVYLCSKVWLKEGMEELLNKSQGLKKVVRAIERRPRLLWLIRLSPYPYNVMNVLLASSSTLSFSCYFWCTALALPKLLIHCSVGTTIRSFAESAKNHGGAGGGEEQAVDGTSPDDDEGLAREMSGQRMKAIAGVVGILLCVGVFIYLLIVARRAVDELDDSDCLPSEGRSRSSSTLEGHSGHQGIPEGRTSMAEYRPLSAGLTSISPGGRQIPSTLVRPIFNNGMTSRKSLDARFTIDDSQSRSSRDSLSMDDRGTMMQRQIFERQDASASNITSLLGSDTSSKSSKAQQRGQSLDLPPSYDGPWSINNDSKRGGSRDDQNEGEEDNDSMRLLGRNEREFDSVVDRLEKAANDRSRGGSS